MNLRNHLVDVVAEFFYTYLVGGRDKDTRRFLTCNPAVLKFLESTVFLGRRLE